MHSSELSGHMGVDRTYLRARDHFFWKGMKEDVNMYVNNCHECMENKSHVRKEPLAKAWPVIPKCFFRVHMDVQGPFSKDRYGNKYIMVFVDSFSRYTNVYAMPDKSAHSVARALYKFICNWGSPDILIHAWATYGPRAKSGPQWLLIWPAETYNEDYIFQRIKKKDKH